MFEVSCSEPAKVQLQLGDKIRWYSRRYHSWIQGEVIEMRITRTRNWVYVAPGEYKNIYGLTQEKIKVEPDLDYLQAYKDKLRLYPRCCLSLGTKNLFRV